MSQDNQDPRRDARIDSSLNLPVESDAGDRLLVADKVPSGAPGGALDDLRGGAAPVHRVRGDQHAPVGGPA